MTSRPGDADEADRTYDEISLKPYFDTLWSYRRVIAASVIGAATFYLVGVLLVFLLSPAEHLSSVPFRLLFDGAEKGEYPNGTNFSTSEIVAGPVLTEVFKVNDLKRFGKYEDFKDSVFVLQSNLDLELLGYEYQARLADTRLSPVDRAGLEAEYRRKREALVDPIYSLTMRRHERLSSMPRDLVNKVLLDVLTTWAKQADERKGATKYNVDVLSPGILHRQMLEQEDYLVAIDNMRAKTARVLATLDEIEKLPGAKALRVGEDRVTVAEVRAELEDVIRFKLEPLMRLILSEGITKNARALSLYASNQLFQLRQQQLESAARVQALQASVREFSTQGSAPAGDTGTAPTGPGGTPGGAITPQLDRSFLDRLMNLSIAKDEFEYRRKITDRVIIESEIAASRARQAAYYEDLAKEVRTSSGRGAAGSPELVALIKTRSAEAFDEIVRGIEKTAQIYKELSAQNLTPSSTVFAVTGPFTQQTERAITLRTVILYLVLIMMLTLTVAPIGCLIHHALKVRRATGAGAAAATA
jgi:hypothetical protein